MSSEDSKGFKDSNETSLHIKSNNIEVIIGNETDEIIEELFESLLQRCQEGLEESMRGRYLFYNGVDLLYYKLHEISLNRGGLYVDSPKWLKYKKAIINLKNNDGKCFQYALTVALNYQSIKKNIQRITKIKPFIDQYNWKWINFSSHKKYWKKFESNNKSISLNILYVLYNTEKIRDAINQNIT